MNNRKMTSYQDGYCEWEGCDQHALYCEGHAHELADVAPLVRAIRECLPDLEHYVATHGLGPDKRLAALRAALQGRRD